MEEEAQSDKIKELEEQVASLTKQNSKLKNELKFTTETERWAELQLIKVAIHIIFFLKEDIWGVYCKFTERCRVPSGKE